MRLFELRDRSLEEIEAKLANGYRIVCGNSTPTGWTVLLERELEQEPILDLETRVLSAVATYYETSVPKLLTSKQHVLSRARYVAADVLRRHGRTAASIGASFGLDTSTIIHGWATVHESAELKVVSDAIYKGRLV